jgi:hypothetical protein
MALNRYVLTADVSIAASSAAAVVAGEPSSGGEAGYGSDEVVTGGEGYFTVVLLKNTVIMLDPAGAVFTDIGSGNLRAYVQGQDDVGHAGLSN